MRHRNYFDLPRFSETGKRPFIDNALRNMQTENNFVGRPSVGASQHGHFGFLVPEICRDVVNKQNGEGLNGNQEGWGKSFWCTRGQ